MKFQNCHPCYKASKRTIYIRKKLHAKEGICQVKIGSYTDISFGACQDHFQHVLLNSHVPWRVCSW